VFHLRDNQRGLGEDQRVLLSHTHGPLEVNARPVWACICGAVYVHRSQAERCCEGLQGPEKRSENWMFGAVKLAVEIKPEEMEDDEDE
jgi:hypothetical protein